MGRGKHQEVMDTAVDGDIPSRKCTSITRSTGKTCKNWAIPGLTVCRLHGGGSERSKAAGRRRVEEVQVKFRAGQLGRALAERMDLDEPDPGVGILESCRRAAAMMRVYGDLVGELTIKPEYEERMLPDGTTMLWPIGMQGLDGSGSSAMHVLVREYRRSIRDYAEICSLAIRAGVEVAKVRIEQQKAEALAAVLQAVLRDLRLTPEQHARAPALIRHHLLQAENGQVVTLEAEARETE